MIFILFLFLLIHKFHPLPCNLWEQKNLPPSSTLRSHKPDRPLNHVSHKPVWFQSSGEIPELTWRPIFRSLFSLSGHYSLLPSPLLSCFLPCSPDKPWNNLSHPFKFQPILNSLPTPFSFPAHCPPLGVNVSAVEDCSNSQWGSEWPQRARLLHGLPDPLLFMPLTWGTVFKLDYRNVTNYGYIFKTCTVLPLNMVSGF